MGNANKRIQKRNPVIVDTKGGNAPRSNDVAKKFVKKTKRG